MVRLTIYVLGYKYVGGRAGSGWCERGDLNHERKNSRLLYLAVTFPISNGISVFSEMLKMINLPSLVFIGGPLNDPR